jgi:hypothetical protein
VGSPFWMLMEDGCRRLDLLGQAGQKCMDFVFRQLHETSLETVRVSLCPGPQSLRILELLRKCRSTT